MTGKHESIMPPGLQYITDNIIRKDNILGASKNEATAWAKDIPFAKDAKTIFFAGCGYQYTTGLESLVSLIRRIDKSPININKLLKLQKSQKPSFIDPASSYRKVMSRANKSDSQPLIDAVKILKSFGLDFFYLAEEEPCCGALLYYTGIENTFAENAIRVYQKFKSHNINKIISIVPSCTYTLRALFPKYIRNFDIEVKHFLEIVLDRIKIMDLRLSHDIKVTYHDPCQLSRYLGIIEEPRQILKSIKGIHLLETDWTNREWATCCGGGGGFEAVFPALSEILAVNRTKELIQTGAEIIVTHCPGCIMQLKHGLKQLKINNVIVMDITQIIAKALGL